MLLFQEPKIAKNYTIYPVNLGILQAPMNIEII